MIYDFAHILCSHLQTERHGWRLDWWCSCEWTWVYSVIAMKLWFTRQPSDTKRIWNVVVLGLKVKVWFYIAFYLVVPTQFIIPFILVDCCVWGWVWVVQQASWCVQIFICCHTVHNTWRWLEQIHHHNQNSNNSSGLDISNHSLEETSNKTGSWGVCANVCNSITHTYWGPQDVLHQTSPSRCIEKGARWLDKTSWCTSCTWGSQTYNKTTAFVNHTQLGSSGCLYIPNFTQRSSWGNAIYPSSYMVAYLFRQNKVLREYYSSAYM